MAPNTKNVNPVSIQETQKKTRGGVLLLLLLLRTIRLCMYTHTGTLDRKSMSLSPRQEKNRNLIVLL